MENIFKNIDFWLSIKFVDIMYLIIVATKSLQKIALKVSFSKLRGIAGNHKILSQVKKGV